MNQKLIFIYLTLLFGCNSSLVIENVERNYDISTQLLKASIKLTIKNDKTTPVKEFKLLRNPLELGEIAYITVKNQQKTNLVVQRTNEIDYIIKLSQPLEANEVTTMNIEFIRARSIRPYPKEITQKERQLVKFITTLNFYTDVPIVEDKLAIKTNTKSIEAYTKILKLTSLSDTTITYGPFNQVEPLTGKEIMVHYENNSPFMMITRLLRTIEVSHWGNIAVEENIDVMHTGAVLKGPFSRYELQRDANSGLNSVKSFKTILPASAKDIYYRDFNGNVSTSHTKVKRDSVELDLRPRFPLFGGWKTQYTLGYNVPSYEYLYNSNDDYVLKFRFIDHVFDDMYVLNIVTKVILPEGSTPYKVKTPYNVLRLPDSYHYTYLDLQGRPTISMTKDHLVENHIQDFEISYTFPKIMMFQEPLLVFTALFILFTSIIVYSRLDFSLKPKNKHH